MTRTPALDGWPGLDAVHARASAADLVRRTPVLTSRTLGEECGGTVLLKAENLQRTVFKLRGALAKLGTLQPGTAWWPGALGTTRSRSPTPRARAACSARSSCPPRPLAKVAAVRGFGGTCG